MTAPNVKKARSALANLTRRLADEVGALPVPILDLSLEWPRAAGTKSLSAGPLLEYQRRLFAALDIPFGQWQRLALVLAALYVRAPRRGAPPKLAGSEARRARHALYDVIQGKLATSKGQRSVHRTCQRLMRQGRRELPDYYRRRRALSVPTLRAHYYMAKKERS
jgi:hypothetical protein